MTDRSLESMIDQLQRVAAKGDDSVPDGELLMRFLKVRDSAAFELIVWRHGGMVRAVCRRVLGARDEVDDAFQATFLVLLKCARSIRNRDSLASWLHGVAFRCAHRCLRAKAIRMRGERRAAQAEMQSQADLDQSDIGRILHAEIERLPERLRQPVVLCAVEGRTDAEAANMLAVPYGTLISRLSRARQRLRNRLTRRGIALGAGDTGLALATEPVSAALVESAVQFGLESNAGTATASSAVALARGVIQTMYIRKLKLIAVSLLTTMMFFGVGLTVASRLTSAAETPNQVAKLNPPASEPPASADKNRPSPQSTTQEPKPNEESPLELLTPTKPLHLMHPDEIGVIGSWQLQEAFVSGESRDPENTVLSIGAFGTMLLKKGVAPDKDVPMTYRLDPTAKPPSIDLTSGGKTQKGIYSLVGDNLQICFNANSGARPESLNSIRGSGAILFRFVRGSVRSPETNWAEKMFENGLSHDFGVIEEGEKPVFVFKFKNIYNWPVRIYIASGLIGFDGSIDSTFRISPKTGDWIEPGQTSEVEIQLLDPEYFARSRIYDPQSPSKHPKMLEPFAHFHLKFVIKGVDQTKTKIGTLESPGEGDSNDLAGQRTRANSGRPQSLDGATPDVIRRTSGTRNNRPETLGASIVTLTVTCRSNTAKKK
jgi:RNA polymerase sigma factor (sigma-70 family)